MSNFPFKSSKKRAAMGLDNASILSDVKQWCQENLNIDLKNDAWDEVEWKDVHENSFVLSVTLLLKGDGVENKKEREKMAEKIINHVKGLLEKSLTESKPAKRSTNLGSSFNIEYKGNAAKDFERFITKNYNEWITNKNQWHSPYTAIVQSSGYGKSRLIKEFACTQTNWLAVYFCYRKEGVSGYPIGNSQARNYMTEMAGEKFATDSDAIQPIIQWFHAWRFIRIEFHRKFCEKKLEDFNIYLTEFGGDIDVEFCKKNLQEYKNYLKGCGDDDGVLNKIKENYMNLFDDMQDYCRNGAKDQDILLKEAVAFWNLCENHTTAAILHTHVERIALHFELLDQTKGFRDEKLKALAMPVFFAFDEARFLLDTNIKSVEHYTMFRAVRGALKAMTSNVFAVFVDTTSQVGNFVPPTESDVSSRYVVNDTMKIGTKLFHPYNEIDTMDVLCVDLNDIIKSHRVFLLGRPLWKSTYDVLQDSPNEKLEALKSFAESKLTCDKADGDEIVAIAAMAVATDMNISPMLTIVDKLVGSHMATCLAIEDNREAMSICYPVEPILSEVVLSLLKRYNDGNKLGENILKHLISHLRIGTLNDGFTGELVVKLLLLLARGRASQPFEQCTLKDFLAELIDGQFSLPGSHKIEEIHLSFTCFTKVMREEILFNDLWMHENPQKVLQAFYDRNAALEFPLYQRGADLLLPVKSNKNEFKYILVQVKNVATTGSVISGVKLTPEYVFGEESEWCKYALKVSLLINVGWVLPQNNETSKQIEFHDKENVVEIKGLDIFAPISENTKDNLRKILKGYVIRKGEEGNDSYHLSCHKLRNVVVNSTRVKRKKAVKKN